MHEIIARFKELSVIPVVAIEKAEDAESDLPVLDKPSHVAKCVLAGLFGKVGGGKLDVEATARALSPPHLCGVALPRMGSPVSSVRKLATTAEEVSTSKESDSGRRCVSTRSPTVT